MFLLYLVVASVTADQCTTLVGEMVEATSQVPCLEWEWSGWLNNGICDKLNLTQCSQGSCWSDGFCEDSVYGTLCAECSYSGYLNDGLCECYDSILIPRLNCTSPLRPLAEYVEVTTSIYKVTCEAFRDPALGCFRYVEGIAECCSEVMGPPPGQLVESGLTPWQECNTYGTVGEDGYFHTCSGHGVWVNDVCVCDPEWNGVMIGNNPYDLNEEVYSCNECFGFWGEPNCTKWFIPDEYGVRRECSGHGEFVDGVCVCDASEDAGFWSSETLTTAFWRVLGSGESGYENQTVETCSKCQSGYTGLRCDEIRNDTQSPSSNPTQSCPVCQNLGSVSLIATFVNPQVDSRASCCDSGQVDIRESQIGVSGGTCIESVSGRMHLGAVWCRELECTVFTWTEERLEVTFRFTKDDSYVMVPSVMSGAGRKCPEELALH